MTDTTSLIDDVSDDDLRKIIEKKYFSTPLTDAEWRVAKDRNIPFDINAFKEGYITARHNATEGTEV